MYRLFVIGIAMLASVLPVAADALPLKWLAYDGGPLPSNWTVAGSEIHHLPGGGDIRSAEQYGDFELDFDWQITAGGNSGVFYRVPAAAGGNALNGPEYQILDNAGHPDGKSPVTSAASAYAVYPPISDMTKPVGSWNSARIVVRGSHVEHWLNDVEVLSYELGSPDWKARVEQSKFRGTAYGTAAQGYIVLQDHGAAVNYRNLRISTGG